MSDTYSSPLTLPTKTGGTTTPASTAPSPAPPASTAPSPAPPASTAPSPAPPATITARGTVAMTPEQQARLGVAPDTSDIDTSFHPEDFIPHAINSALLGLPQAVASDQTYKTPIGNIPVGKIENAVLLGLPQKLIDAAGGKDALLEKLKRGGSMASLGDIAGEIPYMAAGPEGFLKNAALGGGTQAVRSINEGDQNPLASVAGAGLTAGLMGALGGRGYKKMSEGGTLNPSETLAKAQSKAGTENLAANLNLGKRDLMSFWGNTIKPIGGSAEFLKDAGDVGIYMNKNGLYKPANMKNFSEGNAQGWNLADEVNKNFNVNDIRTEIDQLPEVRTYLDKAKGSSTNTDKEIYDIMDRADGMKQVQADPKDPNSPMVRQQVQTPTFKDRMDILDSAVKSAHEQANAPAQVGQNLTLKSELRAKADALSAIRDAYIDKGLGNLEGTPEFDKLKSRYPTIASPEDLRNGWKIKKLNDISQTNADLASFGASNPHQNSTTAFRMAPQHVARNLVGEQVGRATNAALGGINRGVSNLRLKALTSPFGAAAYKAIAPKMGAIVGQGTGQAVGNVMQTPSESQSQGTPGSSEGQQPDEQTMAAVGGPGNESPSYQTDPNSQAGQIQQYVQGLQSKQASMGSPNSNGGTPAQTQVLGPSGFSARNASRGWGDSPMDAALDRGLQQASDLQLRDIKNYDPAGAAEYARRYKERALAQIHSMRGSDGKMNIDPTMAARILFPNNDQKQKMFTQAALEDKTIREAFTSGAGSAGGILGAGGIDIKKYLPNMVGPMGGYNAIRSIAERDGGAPLAAQIDNVMRNPIGTPGKKMQQIRQAFQDTLPQQWEVYNQATGGQ